MATHEHIPRWGRLKGALAAPFAVGASPLWRSHLTHFPALLVHCERCREVWLATSDHSGEDSPEDKAAWEAFKDAEKAIETTVTSTPGGVAAQIRYLRGSYVGSAFGLPNKATDEVPVASLDVIFQGLGRIGH